MWKTSCVLLACVLVVATVNGALLPDDNDLLSGGSSRGFRGIKNLVAFGDSYTDENRLNYFATHNGSAPPVGYIPPASNDSSTGGFNWVRDVVNATGINLYNYAVSGAVCSNALTPRLFSTINADFPAVKEYEVPAFIADQGVFKLNMKETLFSIWIGTNDMGGDCLISHSQQPGVGLSNFTNCVFEQLNALYDIGARNFILQNLAPLQYSPLYADAAHGGSPGPNRFWHTKGNNITDISGDMFELVTSANEIWKWQSPVEVNTKLKGAKLALFDSYGLMLDIYNNPTEYLAPPFNVTGHTVHCNEDGSVCFDYMPDERDGFFWEDELHPGIQTDRIIAKEFIKTIQGTSKYATFW